MEDNYESSDNGDCKESSVENPAKVAIDHERFYAMEGVNRHEKEALKEFVSIGRKRFDIPVNCGNRLPGSVGYL